MQRMSCWVQDGPNYAAINPEAKDELLGTRRANYAAMNPEEKSEILEKQCFYQKAHRSAMTVESKTDKLRMRRSQYSEMDPDKNVSFWGK